jgi:hypothetical protein
LPENQIQAAARRIRFSLTIPLVGCSDHNQFTSGACLTLREWFTRTIYIARQTAWQQARICLVLNLIVPFVRLFGISAVVPFIFVVVNPAKIQEVRLLRTVYEMFGITDTHRFLLALGAATILLLTISNLVCLLVEQFNRRFAFIVH